MTSRANSRPGNPKHQRLFARPKAPASASTALAVPELPKAQTVTGDREVDALLWLREVCKHARDVHVLDLALQAAAKIQTPHKELEDRYTDWLKRQPGLHPLQVALSTLGEIDKHVQGARERIRINAEGLTAFGSLDAALEPSAPEQMLERTARLPDDYEVWIRLDPEQLTAIFARSVNPATLTECATELSYWSWLYEIRAEMLRTEHPGSYPPDDLPVVSARREYVEGLLAVLAPLDRLEAIWLADRLKDGLVGIGSVDDGGRQAQILDHLLRTCP